MPEARLTRVALDAMGGDFAPTELVRGAVDAACDTIEVLLYGDESVLKAELSSLPLNPAVSVVPTSQVVSMHESPVEAHRKKPDSSLRRSIEAVQTGEAQAVVSAGNTGAAMASALLTLGRIEGVDRPAIATALPSEHGHALLIDAGANVDCSAENLYQFAIMGLVYVRLLWKIPAPTIGLLSNGEESSKGNALTKHAHERLRASCPGFIGNVEARELFAGKADVVVCDGFVGNVLLKAGEGVAEMIGSALRDMAPVVGAEIVQGILRNLRSKMDYAVYGGAPLLGLNGVCMIAHGRSRAVAIANALRHAAQSAASGMVVQIGEQIRQQVE